jgi:hypothetical protein
MPLKTRTPLDVVRPATDPESRRTGSGIAARITTDAMTNNPVPAARHVRTMLVVYCTAVSAL